MRKHKQSARRARGVAEVPERQLWKVCGGTMALGEPPIKQPPTPGAAPADDAD